MEDWTIRPARVDDAPAVADLHLLAGGGIFEFLFDDIEDCPDARTLMQTWVPADAGALSWRNTSVAELAGSVIGQVTCLPDADGSARDFPPFVPADRVELVRPFGEAREDGSWMISTIAVGEQGRGRGIGRALIETAAQRGRTADFTRISLRVFADNLPARRLYETAGFTITRIFNFSEHPRLPHTGGAVLMGRDL